MKKLLMIAAAVLLLIQLNNVSAVAQSCSPPVVELPDASKIIFTPEQEMWLGEAILERSRTTYGIIDDPDLTTYLQGIVDRLARHLPQKGIKFRVYLSDDPRVNASSIAGGVVLINRKLIKFARTEDELAFVVAHELGHGTVRHGAITFSKIFKRLLKVDKLTDRADVINRYNEYLDTWNTKDIGDVRDIDDEQHEADRLGVFAMAAAGYDPGQIQGFWQRFTKAKKKNAFLVFFGGNEAEIRLKAMIDQYKDMPAACREKRSIANIDAFEGWRNRVITFNGFSKTESIPGLISRTVLSPIRSDLTNISFSPNGKFILAQDPSSVTVLSRDPLRVLFQVPVKDARPAQFSADSATFLVVTGSLHYQRWEIASGQSLEDDEVAVPGTVWQSRMSSDGKYLAVFSPVGDLVIYEAASGDELFRKKEFVKMSLTTYWLQERIRDITEADINLIGLKFSPDGRYLFAGTTSAPWTQDASIVVDLDQKKAIPVGDNVKKLIKNSFEFLSSDRLVGRINMENADSGVFSFPEGKRIEQIDLGGFSFTRSSAGNYLVVRPVTGAAVGVFDLRSKKYVFAGKKSALDVYEDLIAAERKNGELALYKLGASEPIASIELPKSNFGLLRTVSFSEDGAMLAASDSSRGAVWSLPSGEASILLRSFYGSFVTSDHLVYADFPRAGDMDRTVAKITPASKSVEPGISFIEDRSRQFGQFFLTKRSMEKEDKRDTMAGDVVLVDPATGAVRFVQSNMELEAKDVVTRKRIWIRQFPNEAPRYGVNSNADTICFVWDADSKATREAVKLRPDLTQKIKGLDEKRGDYYIEVADLASGVTRSYLFIETGNASFEIKDVVASGDYILLSDDNNRILIYSVSNGDLLRRVFGTHAVVNAAAGTVAVENSPGRIAIYDIRTGKELKRLTFKNDVVAMRFSKDGKRFFALAADQTAFVIDPSGSAH